MATAGERTNSQMKQLAGQRQCWECTHMRLAHEAECLLVLNCPGWCEVRCTPPWTRHLLSLAEDDNLISCCSPKHHHSSLPQDLVVLWGRADTASCTEHCCLLPVSLGWLRQPP